MADPVDTLSIERPEAVRAGLPAGPFEALSDVLGLTIAQTAALVGMSPRTAGRRLEEGQFQPGESDRIARVARIVALALETFGRDREDALTWLRSPHPLLSDEPPLERLDTEIGARAVEDVLNAIRYGFAA